MTGPPLSNRRDQPVPSGRETTRTLLVLWWVGTAFVSVLAFPWLLALAIAVISAGVLLLVGSRLLDLLD